MNIKRGDTVKVLYGKDSGKTGSVVSVLRKKDMVLVNGVNKVTRHVKGDGKTKKSEIVNVERPMNAAKVMLVCPNCNKPTRVKTERKGDGYVRICKKCKKEIENVIKKEVKKEEKKETKSKTKTSKK